MPTAVTSNAFPWLRAARRDLNAADTARLWEYLNASNPEMRADRLRGAMRCTGCRSATVSADEILRMPHRTGDIALRIVACRACACCTDCCTCNVCLGCERHVRASSSDYCRDCNNCSNCCTCRYCDRCNHHSPGFCSNCGYCDNCCEATDCNDGRNGEGGGRMPRFESPLKFHAAGIADRKVNASRRFLAVEIEVAGVKEDRGVSTAVRNWSGAIVSDGSLPYEGFEINTAPAAGDKFVKQIEEISDALKASRGKITDACGLHCHIDARDLTYYGIRRLLKMYATMEPFLFQLVPENRRRSNYCQPCGERYRKEIGKLTDYSKARKSVVKAVYGQDDTRDRRSHKYDNSRYSALNVHSWYYRGTVECRMFGGTIRAAKIVPWGMMWAKILDYAATATDKEIDALCAAPMQDALADAQSRHDAVINTANEVYRGRVNEIQKMYNAVEKPAAGELQGINTAVTNAYYAECETIEGAFNAAINDSRQECNKIRENASRTYEKEIDASRKVFFESQRTPTDRNAYYKAVADAENTFEGTIMPAESTYNDVMQKADVLRHKSLADAKNKKDAAIKEAKTRYDNKVCDAAAIYRRESETARQTQHTAVTTASTALQRETIAIGARFANTPDDPMTRAYNLLDRIIGNTDIVRKFVKHRIKKHGTTSAKAVIRDTVSVSNSNTVTSSTNAA